MFYQYLLIMCRIPMMVLLIVFGTVLTVVGGPLLRSLGIPLEDDGITGMIGLVLAVVGFLRLALWWITSKMDHLVIKSDS